MDSERKKRFTEAADSYSKELTIRIDASVELEEKQRNQLKAKESVISLLENEPGEKSHNRTNRFFMYGNVRLCLVYVPANPKGVELHYEKDYEIIDLDNDSQKKDTSELSKGIINWYEAFKAQEDAAKVESTSVGRLRVIEANIQAALPYGKLVKYKGRTFQTYSAGYYGEVGLRIQKFDITSI